MELKYNFYILLVCVVFTSCSKKMTFEQFRKTYPCEVGKSETSTVLSTTTDTIYLSRKEYAETNKMPSKEIKSIEIGNDSLMIIRITNTIENTVKIPVKDSAEIQGYKNDIQGLENRSNALDAKNKALENEVGDYKLKIEKMKGSGRISLIMSIIPWVIIALVAMFFIYVWYHNKT